MDINPYQSPEQSSSAQPAQSPQWNVFAQRRPQKVVQLERPTGVTLLCLVQVASIALQFVVSFGVLLPGLLFALRVLRIPIGPYLVMVLMSWVFGLVAAGGMWEGKRWGWWCGAFYCAHNIWHSIFDIGQVIMLMHSQELAGRPEGLGYAIGFTIRIPILALIFTYFFSPNFLAYVGRAPERRGSTAAWLLGLAAAEQLLQIGLLWLLH